MPTSSDEFVWRRAGWLATICLLCTAGYGCGGSQPAASPVMTESQHTHYHVHAADASHEHSHENGAAPGGHVHAHQHDRE
jgi:hypothetical protein